MLFEKNVRVLVVRQPYAWLIVNGWKDVENRTYATTHRGQILILAAVNKAVDHEEAYTYCYSRNIPLPRMHELRYGGIIGLTRVVGLCRESESPWFSGPFGWQLAESRPLPFVAAKGMLGLFRPSTELLKKIEEKEKTR